MRILTNKNMKKIFLFLLLLCSLSVQSFSQDDEYRQAVLDMMEISNTLHPEIDSSFWDEFEGEFMASSMDDLVDRFLPIYKNHLSLEELQGIIKFYKTPVGKKLIEKTPLIMQESMELGKAWGQEISETALRKLKEKGY